MLCYFLILLQSAVITTVVLGGYFCPNVELQVPPGFNFSRSPSFTYSDGALQIYSGLRFGCDGWIVEWRFLTRTAIINGLNIAVFRQRMFEPVFDLVATTFVDDMATPDDRTDVWIKHRLDKPIAVRTGDCIGVFYSDQESISKFPLAAREDFTAAGVDQMPTYVMLAEGNELWRSRRVDVTDAAQTNREVALIGIITGRLPYTSSGNVQPRRLPWWNRVNAIPKMSTAAAHPSADEVPMLSHGENNVTITSRPTVPRRCYNRPRAQEDPCFLPSWRAYYEADTSTCRPFFGCRPIDKEANNFDSREHCQMICPEKLRPRPVLINMDDHHHHHHNIINQSSSPIMETSPTTSPPPTTTTTTTTTAAALVTTPANDAMTHQQDRDDDDGLLAAYNNLPSPPPVETPPAWFSSSWPFWL